MMHFAADSSQQQRAQAVRVDGQEHLEAALARGRGAILWEVPFGDPTLGKIALRQRGFSLVQVRGPWHGGARTWFGQTVIRSIHRRFEARLFEEIISLDIRSLVYLRRIVERLHSNKIVCTATLGSSGLKFVATQFLGKTQHLPTGVMTLARQTGAALITMFCFTDGDQDRLVLSSPLPVSSVDSGDKGLIRLADLFVSELSAFVEKHPEQWWGWPPAPSRLDQLAILGE